MYPAYIFIWSNFLVFLFSLSYSAPRLFTQERVESEYKLDLPPHLVDELWTFMTDTFAHQILTHYDSSLTSAVSDEFFVDVYFDTPRRDLAFRQMGLRYRKRYLADTLSKELVQLKLPLGDSTGVARTEMKFRIYRKVKKGDRRALHPFWRLIRPADRAELSRELIYYGVEAEELQVALTLEQRRRRLYIQKNGDPLITLTLDEVRHRAWPKVGFAELEMELNELRYTAASPQERQLMENLNRQFKREISKRFPEIRQDQRPKYNKLLSLTEEQHWVAYLRHWPYLLLLVLVLAGLWALKQQW